MEPQVLSYAVQLVEGKIISLFRAIYGEAALFLQEMHATYIATDFAEFLDCS